MLGPHADRSIILTLLDKSFYVKFDGCCLNEQFSYKLKTDNLNLYISK